MQSRLSLRERLVILMVAATLPLFALSFWLALRETGAATQLAQSQMKFAASLVAANQDAAVESARQLLGAISALPRLRSGGQSRCQSYFEGLRNDYPMYSNIGLLSVDGQLVCHANGRMGEASAADRGYFRAALAQRRFVMGEVIVGRLSGVRSLPFAAPVMEDGEVTGIVFATLALEQAGAALSRLQLPDGARVVVADRHDRVLMDYPPRNTALPRDLTTAVVKSAAQTMTSGVGEGHDRDGMDRIYAYVPSTLLAGEGFLAIVSIDKARVAGASFDKLRQELLVLGLSLLLGVAAAWWIGGRVIVQPAGEIVDVVQKLEAGALDVRIPMRGRQQRGEFARIGAAFNLMAESLQLRQHDRDIELGRSRSAYAVLDLVLNSMQDALLAVNSAGQFLLFNHAATRLFPLQGPPALLRQWPHLYGLYHPDGTTLFRPDELPMVRALRGETGLHLQMVVRNALVPAGCLLQCSYQPMRDEAGISGGLVVFTDVTALQRLQDEQALQFRQLRDTQLKLIEAQRVGRIGNWDIDLATGRVWWSEEVFRLFGVSPADFSGTVQDFLNRVHPDDLACHTAAREAATTRGRPMNMEYRIIRPDGQIAWMHDIAEMRRGGDGRPVWYGGVVQDITARKEAERALTESERELQEFTVMLQRAADAAQDITSRKSLEDTLTAVADQVRYVIGARQAEVSLTVDSDWALAVAEAGHPLRLTQDELLAHPRWRQFGGMAGQPPLRGLLAVPLVDRNGGTTGLLLLSDKEAGDFNERDEYAALELSQMASIAIDNVRLLQQVLDFNAGLEARIAERTAELEQQERLYRTLAEQAPEVIWNTDATGERLTFLNRAWYELMGGTPDDWLGHSGLSAVHPDDRDEVAGNWRNALATLSPLAGVRRLRARDGSYHSMSYRGSPVFGDHGQVAFWVGIDTDITELKAIERALRGSNQELEAFSYSVSHDLRAPLGAIGGFSRALSHRLEALPDERAHHFLARIQAGVERMEQLIESLLGLAKVVRAPLRFGEVDLGALARETVEGLREAAPGRKVSVTIADDLLALGDVRLLRIAMENLLGNAWKFTSQREDAAIEVGRLPDSKVFYVRDNGVGFDMAYVDKLFGAFQRLHTEAEFPGTGIGLATVRRIVTRHQGRVWGESQLGLSTTFYFVLSELPPPSWLAGSAARAA